MFGVERWAGTADTAARGERSSRTGQGGTGRGWTGLDGTGLDWTGLDWTGPEGDQPTRGKQEAIARLTSSSASAGRLACAMAALVEDASA